MKNSAASPAPYLSWSSMLRASQSTKAGNLSLLLSTSPSCPC
jgi:hypothetical protein